MLSRTKLPPKSELDIDDFEAVGAARERRELLAREVLETRRGQMVLVRRIRKGIVRAEVRRGDKHVRVVLSHTVDLRHGAHDITQMFNDVRHVDAGKLIALQRPGDLIQFACHIRR